MTVLGLIPTVWGKTSKISYLRELSAQVSQIVFLAHLTVLRFIITVWGKTSKISYLSKFSAQVSQIVFWAHLTVLRLITSVWGKTSKISYLREFSAQVSQIVFSAHLTVLRLPTTVWDKLQKSHISVSSVHKYHKSCSEFNWPFYDLLQLYEEKLQKSLIVQCRITKFSAQVSQSRVLSFSLTVLRLITTVWGKTSKISYPVSSVHKYHKSCSELIWPFYGLLQLYEVKLQKSHILWGKTSKISWVQCTSITNRVLSSFDRFTTYYNCMRKNFKNLISPWVQCKSITNRVLVSYDHFRAYSNCMR